MRLEVSLYDSIAKGSTFDGAAPIASRPEFMKDVTKRLQSWYAQSCDGSWEHQHGVRIDTIDNPGWSVRIDIRGTELEGRGFETILLERGPDDWLRCELKDGVYEAVGGPQNLTELLDVFLGWATPPGAPT